MLWTPEDIETYCLEKSTGPSALCREIEEYTWKNVGRPQMVSGAMVAGLLGFLIRSHRVKKILEVGTFTGYSALAMAECLPADGSVDTVDINAETTAVAKAHWARSPHGEKIISHLGEGLELLPRLPGPYDLIFIDGDKRHYLDYFQLALEKLSPTGIIILDNCLWSGKVLQKTNQETSTRWLMAVNDHIAGRSDLYKALLPIRDGLFLVGKLP